MKEFSIVNLPLGAVSAEEGFERVFGPDTMRKIHGDDMKLTHWNHKKERTFQFYVDVPQVPNEIKRFFCGNRLKITTRQHRTDESPDLIHVKNKVKLHVLGAELVSVKPRFTIQHQDRQSYLSVQIQHKARFPPPLNSLIEHFMLETSQRAFQTFLHVLQ